MPKLVRRRWLWLTVCGLLTCSCSSAPRKADTEVATPATVAPAVKAPQVKAPVQIVYTAAATEQSNATIEEALLAAREGQTATAISSLESVLAGDSKAFLAAFNLGVLYDQKGEPGRARSMYEKALEIEPEFAPALINLVRLEIRQGQPAMQTAERYIALRTQNIELKFAKIEAMIAQGAYSDAVSLAQELMRLDEENTRLRYYMALAHFRAGRPRLCEFILEQTLEMAPDDAEARYLLGLVLIELDSRIAARAQLASAVALRGDFPEAQNAMGLFYFETREFEEAEAAFRTALRYSPRFKEALLNLGNTQKAMLQGDEAERSYLEVIRLDEAWADGHFSLGILYLADVIPLASVSGMERLDKAKKELETARGLTQGDEPGLEQVQAFLVKTENAIGILQAEIELQQLDGGGGDPFGDPFGGDSSGGDPFGDDAGKSDEAVEGGGSAPPVGDDGAAPEPDDVPFEEDK